MCGLFLSQEAFYKFSTIETYSFSHLGLGLVTEIKIIVEMIMFPGKKRKVLSYK